MTVSITAAGVGGASLGLNVVDFGADPTGAADSAPAIQDAIDSIRDAASLGAPAGGTIYFPRGTYKCNSSIDLMDTWNIVLKGEGNSPSGQVHQAATKLLYTGSGDRFLDCRSSDALVLEGLGILYSNASFTGSLVDFSHSPVSGADSVCCVIEKCLLYPTIASCSAHCLVNLENTIIFTIRDCKLGGAAWAILGRPNDGSGYSNSVNIYDSTFDNCLQAFLGNAGERWSIRGNCFELLNTIGVVGVTPWIYKSDISGASSLGGNISFCDNWCGDMSGSTLGYIYIDPRETISSFACMGNTFPGGTSASIKLYGPIYSGIITGNVFSIADSSVSPIELGGATGASLGGGLTAGIKSSLVVTGNSISGLGSGTEFVKDAEKHRRVCVFANDGYNYATRDVFQLGGHLILTSADPAASTPQIAAGAAAGTGPTVAVAGNDTSGQITVTTGTSPGTGELFTLTWISPFQDLASDIQPKIFLQPRDATTSAAPVLYANYAANQRTTMSLRTATALAASTTYKWSYLVVQ